MSRRGIATREPADPRTLGLPRGSRVAAPYEDVIPTISGALVLHYTLPGRHQPTVLARSIDAGWSKFTRVGSAPRTGPIAAKGDVLWNCDRFRPESHGACSYSTDLGDTWHTTHLPR